MRIMILLAILAMPVLLCSCRTGVTVEGDPCYALSESEMNELVTIARVSLRRPHRQLTADDVRTISTVQPMIRIDYYSDYSGEVKIRWELKDKIAGVRFKGLLNDPRRRHTIFEIIPQNDRVIYQGVPGRRNTE